MNPTNDEVKEAAEASELASVRCCIRHHQHNFTARTHDIDLSEDSCALCVRHRTWNMVKDCDTNHGLCPLGSAFRLTSCCREYHQAWKAHECGDLKALRMALLKLIRRLQRVESKLMQKERQKNEA